MGPDRMGLDRMGLLAPSTASPWVVGLRATAEDHLRAARPPAAGPWCRAAGGCRACGVPFGVRRVGYRFAFVATCRAQR